MKKLILLISVFLASCASAPSLQVPLATRQAQPTPLTSSAVTATIDVAPTIAAYEAQAAEAAAQIAQAQAAKDEAERQLYNQQVAIDSGNLTVAAITHEVYQTNVAIESTNAAYRPTADWMLVLREKDSRNAAEKAKTDATRESGIPTQIMAEQMAKEYVDSQGERDAVRRIGYVILLLLGLAAIGYLVVMFVKNGVEAEAIAGREKREAEQAAHIPNLGENEPQANATTQDEETPTPALENAKQAGFVVPCNSVVFTALCANVINLSKSPISHDALVNILQIFETQKEFDTFRIFAQSVQWIRSAGTGVYQLTDAGRKVFTDWLENERLPSGYSFMEEGK